MSLKTNIKILPVLAPENVGADGGALEYTPKNRKAHLLNVSQEPIAWDQFMSTEPGSLDERKAARDLAEIYLGATATQLETGIKDSDTLSRQAEWLTHQSVEIYGDQDVEETTTVLQSDLSFFISLIGNDAVDQDLLSETIDEYSRLGIRAESQEVETLEESDRLFADAIVQNYGFILERFDPESTYGPEDLIMITKDLLKEFTGLVDGFAEWKVAEKADGSMEVDTKAKEIKIGLKRAKSKGMEAGASITHEIVDHILRSVNGEKLEDYDAQYGMPDYLDFEEGLGCYMEFALTGRVPSKIANRQITASLALEQFGPEAPKDRNEIYEFLKKRTLIYLQSEGVTDSSLVDAKLKELRTLIIDRFFRGGKGVEPLRSVYTKDTVYAKGFSKAKKYVHEKLAEQNDAGKLFRYLVSGKFDPTIEEHVSRMKKLGVEL